MSEVDAYPNDLTICCNIPMLFALSKVPEIESSCSLHAKEVSMDCLGKYRY
jgi:hypothetical protein